MTKTKEERLKALSAYKFDTSSYIVMNSSVRRDAQTGRLIQTSQQPK